MQPIFVKILLLALDCSSGVWQYADLLKFKDLNVDLPVENLRFLIDEPGHFLPRFTFLDEQKDRDPGHFIVPEDLPCIRKGVLNT